MNTSKSVRPYCIPTNILKLSCSVLLKPLVEVINFSFSEGIFPGLLKFGNVIPVFMKGDNLDYSNYRPISLISNIGKLVEEDSVVFYRKIIFFLSSSMDLEINCQLMVNSIVTDIYFRQ